MSSKTATTPASQLSEEELHRLHVNRRLNDMRMQPVKQLPMTLFMMWMVGNDVSIFSIMFVGMAVITPIQSIVAAGKMFSAFEEDAASDTQIRGAVNQSRLIYIGCCLVAFFVALMKLNWMGLLPVNAMDWMANHPPTYKEHTIGAFYTT